VSIRRVKSNSTHHHEIVRASEPINAGLTVLARPLSEPSPSRSPRRLPAG
jgi:hypothetical protein